MNRNELSKIDLEIIECNKCKELVEKFTNDISISYGKNSDIVVLGEAPANNGWRKSGKAWYNVEGKRLQSGNILNNLLNIIDVELEDTIFLEAIKCFPKDRKSLKICKRNCNDFLVRQLNLLNPKIIITLGDTATKSVLDIHYKKFSDVAGKIYFINADGRKIKVLPIYHPSPISPIGYKGNIPIFESMKKELMKS